MIPRVIHQTWKTEVIPEQFRELSQSWRHYHPDWEYRLWSDAANRAFLAEHYPAFLPFYDSYRTPICRADAIRYFLLKHYGGLYVDLDFECFQAFDDLAASDRVILGLEPETHVRDHRRLHRGLERIVCNALMASPPGHPFWDHVIEQLVPAHKEPGPLDATGPFFLTRALDSYRGPVPVEVLPASVFYPADTYDCSEGRLFDPENWWRLTGSARAMHHWAGTWWRDNPVASRRPSATARVTLVEAGRRIAVSELSARSCAPFDTASPLVSCLMVTRDRPEQARRAVEGFLAQSYPARELVILDDGADTGLERDLAGLGDARIRYLRLKDDGATLGALRNRALALARGAYVCQWDDDDLYDPARLEMQMTAISALRADACFLDRWLVWWPRLERLAVSGRRLWEGSMLCRKSMVPPYSEVRRGEDTPVAEHIMGTTRVALLDQPRLYVYVVHEGNTFQAEHFESQWQAADQRFEGAAYARVLRELRKRLDIDAYRSGLEATASPARRSESRAVMSAEPAGADPVPRKPPALAATPGAAAKPRRPKAVVPPSVLILTPIKNAVEFLPGFFELARRLDYPGKKLSLAFLEGDSEDGTYEALREHAERHRKDFARIDVYRQDHALRIDGDRWAAEIQFHRRGVISKCRNTLFRAADRGQEKVLWIDADVIAYPADVLTRLLASRETIVVPNCVLTPGGPTFDLNTFKYKPGARARSWSHARDGIIQPPRGEGRLYLDDLRGRELVEVDGVGGTMLLVDAELHRAGILFPDYSYRGYLDTEGFAFLARDRGIAAWGMPDLEIVHASA